MSEKILGLWPTFLPTQNRRISWTPVPWVFKLATAHQTPRGVSNWQPAHLVGTGPLVGGTAFAGGPAAAAAAVRCTGAGRSAWRAWNAGDGTAVMGSGGPHHWAKGTASGTAAAVAGADAAAAAAGWIGTGAPGLGWPCIPP